MGWDGGGGYDRARNFSADASANIRILASAMDEELDDFASAMQNCLTLDGQNSPTDNIPLGGNRLVNGGQAASATDYIRVKEVIENVPIYMIDTASSADRISVSAAYFTGVSATQAPADGTQIKVKMLSDKTTAALYIDGFSANIQTNTGVQPTEVFVSGGVYDFVFNSASSVWQPLGINDVENLPRVGRKFKSANTSRNNTIVLEDDPHLSGWTLELGYYYRFEAYLRFTADDANPDLRWAWQLSTGGLADVYTAQITSGNAVQAIIDSTNFDTEKTGISLGASSRHIVIRGTFGVQTSDTTVDFQWAQNTSDAANVILHQGSWMLFEKLGPY
jgi:hypothetical protein